MKILYEDLVKEQESRVFFDKPTRWTTILTYPHKLNYEEFIDELKQWGLQENLRDGERFIEDWVDLFLCYHEIENHYDNEIEGKNRIIDIVVENLIKYQKYISEKNGISSK